MRRLPALLTAAFLLAACRAPEGPDKRYRRFAEAARTGRAAAAWSMLSRDSRKALETRAKELQAGGPTAGTRISGADLVLGDLASTAPNVKAVTVLRESKEAAVVLVEDEAGARGEVSLVLEGGEWRVVLPGGG